MDKLICHLWYMMKNNYFQLSLWFKLRSNLRARKLRFVYICQVPYLVTREFHSFVYVTQGFRNSCLNYTEFSKLLCVLHGWIAWEFPVLPPLFSNDLIRHVSGDENRFQIIAVPDVTKCVWRPQLEQVYEARKTELLGVAETLLTHIREVFRSNLYWGTDYPDWGFSWFNSAPP